MQTVHFEEFLDKIIAKDPRYRREAYLFLRDALDHTQKTAPKKSKSGVRHVTGKPINTRLPPPFNQVPNIGGVGHQVHHKFIVCGFNGPDPVVYCGSSNLALKGEIPGVRKSSW